MSAVIGRQIRDFGRLDQPWPTVCTFHSLCLRILRHYGPRIGLPTNFSIYDSGDQNKLIKEALKALDLSTTNFPPGPVHAAISNAKNKLLPADIFAQQASDFYQKTVARVYTKYQAMLNANNALDFDDLLLRTAEVFRSHPDVLKELQERYQYLLIDEYQDTNHAQYIIAHVLAQRHKNICVVGDPDQSIYAWRGADLQNILDFEKDYPDAKVVRLEQNYRSTKVILKIASQLIARNRLRKDKTLWTENAEGDKAKLFLCQDERDEAKMVAEQFQQLHEKQGVRWDQMAIFYRMNSLSRVMEDALRTAGMPYVMARGVEFYNRREIKDTLGYLRVVANPNDEVSLTRIINVPARGIGDSSVKQMQAWAVGNGTTLWGAMQQVTLVPNLTTRAANSVKAFVALVCSWQAMSTSGVMAAGDIFSGQKGRVQTITEDVVKRSGLEAMLKKEHAGEETGEDALANIDSLISGTAEYDAGNPDASLQEYLNMVSLVSDVDHLKGNGGAITMMTLHAAKGLEFPVVAMIGLEEGILPHSRARGNPTELEEERRLCFVGITRTEERLILTKANYRTMRGMRERTVTSPFLNELPASSMEVFDRAGLDFTSDRFGRDREPNAAEQLAQEKAGKFHKGMLVRHPTFGLGRIAELNDMGQHTRAVVEFNQAGKKTLILQYARLEPVG